MNLVLFDLLNAKNNSSFDEFGFFEFEGASKSTLEFKTKEGAKLQLNDDDKSAPKLFDSNFSFGNLGIGGLDKELGDIFRKVFSSRAYSQEYLSMYGQKHIKGILLYGPPGTGKTLIARKLSQALNCNEPKIVNGPSLMSKWVGESEKNIRELFEPAIQEYKTNKNGQLHVIVFDEIDAICRARGGNSAGGANVNDLMVNQMLSMIDGVEEYNNILIIGMTNRKDLLDEALLRPGRIEAHIEIPLPDEKGRLRIFEIHTALMRKNKVMEEEISLEALAQRTKNYTGAEIESVVKLATSYLFNRQIKLGDAK